MRVWTDGSGGEDGRSAGAGVFYGRGNLRNRALSVPGKQTSARAELYAAVHVLRTEHRPTSLPQDACLHSRPGLDVQAQVARMHLRD